MEWEDLGVSEEEQRETKQPATPSVSLSYDGDGVNVVPSKERQKPTTSSQDLEEESMKNPTEPHSAGGATEKSTTISESGEDGSSS